MAIELYLTSSAAPESVLAAIREDVREWRESVIPRNIREAGALQVVARINSPKFRLRFDRGWVRGRINDPLEVWGSVKSDGAAGAVVIARCGARGPGIFLSAVFALLAANSLLRDGGTAWWVWSLLAAGSALVDWVNDDRVTRSNPEAEYLVERLEQAVASAHD